MAYHRTREPGLIDPAALSTIGYSAAVENDYPVQLLMLNDNSGAVAYSTIGSNGTYNGNPSLNQSGPNQGGVTKSVVTDGIDDSITVGTMSGTSHAQTFELLFSAGQITSSSSVVYIGGDTGPAVDHVTLGQGTGYLTDEVIALGTGPQYSQDRTGWTGFVIPTGWHHLVLTFSGTQNGWTCYLDGVNVENAPFSATKISNSGGAEGFSSTSFRLSQYGGYFSASSFAGYAYYDVVLSASRVLAHAQAAGLA